LGVVFRLPGAQQGVHRHDCAGVVLGVPAALVVGRLLQNTFVRTEARDVVTLIVTVALLAIVALAASIVPARRATRIKPTAALRIE
jgi:putative ABC transport system permease protein